MNKFLSLPLIFASLTVGTVVHAQTVATDPVGAVSITLKGASDTIVAVPLTPLPNYSGAVSTAASGGTNLYNLNVSGTTGWTANQFAALYYVRMTSGTKNGMYYTITANTTGQVTVDTAGDTLTSIQPGDTFKILKYWTLGTLFPPASAGTAANPLTASAGDADLQRQSQILLPDNAATGINLTASSVYYFTAAGGWKLVAGGSATDTILWPDSYFIIRQPSTLTADATWTCVGNVSLSRLSIPLATRSNGSQDNAVALLRPTDIRLADAGLETGFMDSIGAAAFQRRDLLLVYDNTVKAFNKAASKVFYRYNGNWYQVGNPAVANDQMLLAGSGFVIRKYQNASTAVWTNNPGY